MMSSSFDAAVLYWSRIAHIGFIGCDTKNKGVNVSGWQKLDLDNVDYEANQKAGLYNNGIAIRLGLCLKNGSSKQLYSFALDFDGWDAVIAWYGSWDNVVKAAQKTRIEWHFDQNSIHVFYLSDRPITNKKIHIKDAMLEIRCEGHLLFASPSIHKDGKPYTAMGTEEISILSDWLLLQLEARIDSLSEGYMSNDNKQDYIAYLEDPKTIVKEGGRHHATLVMANSYFFRSAYGWAKLSDEQKYDRLVLWHAQHCQPSLFEERGREDEVHIIWNNVVKRGTDRRQEEREKRQDQGEIGEKEEEKPLAEQLAKSILDKNQFATTTDNEELYWYNGYGRYLRKQEWRIKKACQEKQSNIRISQVNEVIQQVKRRTYIPREIFDSYTDYVNMKDGSVNIFTGELVPHSPDRYFLTQLPYPHDSNAKCPAVLRFFGQVLKPKNVFTALEIFGYCLYKTARFHKALMLVGKGRNGKTVFLKLLEASLDSATNCSHVSLQELSGGDRFAKAELFGKLANICGDLKKDKLKDTGPFKILTSGDIDRGQFKYGQPFDFSNYATLVFSANDIPQIDGDEGLAYFSRWIIFVFETVFYGEVTKNDKELSFEKPPLFTPRCYINDHKAPEFAQRCYLYYHKPKKDTKLIQKLTTPEELSGLFNLSLIALRQLIKEDGFSHVDDIDTVEREYRLNSSTVERFLLERCKVDPTNVWWTIECNDLYRTYLEFCIKNELRAVEGDSQFGMEIKQSHITRDQKRIRQGENPKWCYFGVQLKEEVA